MWVKSSTTCPPLLLLKFLLLPPLPPEGVPCTVGLCCLVQEKQQPSHYFLLERINQFCTHLSLFLRLVFPFYISIGQKTLELLFHMVGFCTLEDHQWHVLLLDVSTGCFSRILFPKISACRLPHPCCAHGSSFSFLLALSLTLCMNFHFSVGSVLPFAFSGSPDPSSPFRHRFWGAVAGACLELWLHIFGVILRWTFTSTFLPATSVEIDGRTAWPATFSWDDFNFMALWLASFGSGWLHGTFGGFSTTFLMIQIYLAVP